MIDRRIIGRRLTRSVIILAALATPAHAIPVFDAANYAQNLIQAARALDQINNQIRSLQNQALMIEGMTRNLQRLDSSSLGALSRDLASIARLVEQAQAIGYQADSSVRQFRSLFSPDSASGSTLVAAQSAEARLRAVKSALQQSVSIQSEVVSGARNDATTLATLLTQSQSASGNLQASQLTNQLLGLVAKQQAELQNLLAVQGRIETQKQASDLQAEADARAAMRRFLGSGTAYTPR